MSLKPEVAHRTKRWRPGGVERCCDLLVALRTNRVEGGGGLRGVLIWHMSILR